MAAPKDPVIIIRKSGHHRHGHHGGAWKVAYADFVTAMMAFFLVMWLVAQGPDVRSSVAAYFRDPGAFAANAGGKGVLPGSANGVAGGGQPGVGPTREKENEQDIERAKAALERAAEHLRQAIQLKFADIQHRIEITVTEEGLRIELSEAPDDGFFSSGSAQMKPETEALLALISHELAQLSNRVAVEGHTDSVPYAGSYTQYSNWELSTDRANAARRVLERTGVRGEKLEGVRGYAATRPRLPEAPADARNRRISIIVRRDDHPGGDGP
ncbi:MAG: OmpA family protein [Acidobacteria bacterium]|nr:OmpA family protein [Acidobacteriota bacterium]